MHMRARPRAKIATVAGLWNESHVSIQCLISAHRTWRQRCQRLLASGARLKGSAILSCECPEREAVGFMDQTHCLVIRGIADCADSQENEMWHPYAVGTTADFAQRLLLINRAFRCSCNGHRLIYLALNDRSSNQAISADEPYGRRLRILTWLSPSNFGPRF